MPAALARLARTLRHARTRRRVRRLRRELDAVQDARRFLERETARLDVQLYRAQLGLALQFRRRQVRLAAVDR